MRIVMFMANMRPGSISWSIYQDFAAAFRRRGHDFELVTVAEPPGEPDAPGTRFLGRRAGLQRIDRLLAPLTRNRSMLATAGSLADFLRGRADVDLLYVEQSFPSGAALALARRRARSRAALVVTPMGEDILRVPAASYGYGRFPLSRAINRWTIRAADGVRWISPLAREHAVAARRPGAEEATIPLSVAAATIEAAGRSAEAARDRRAAARARLAGRVDVGDRRVVLSLGRLHPFKGVHLLVDAMTLLDDAVLVIVGPSLHVRRFGDYATFLRRRAEERGVADRVHLVGGVPHEETGAMLAAADVLVVPSLLESLNKVCVEAVAEGTPVVVTRTTGIAGFLPRDGVGRVIEPGSAAAIASAVGDLLDPSWELDRDAAAAFVRRFDPERVVDEVAALFERVTATRAS